MATPEEVDVWVGLDVGKTDHFADVLDDAGQPLTARGVVNDEAALEALLETAAEHGTPGLVIEQPGSIAQLAMAVAARRGVPVALRARAGDAPGGRSVSGGGQDRPAGRVRAR